MAAPIANRVVVISRKYWDNEKNIMRNVDVYVGHTRRKIEHFLLDFKSQIKTAPESVSQKIQALNVNANELYIRQVSTAATENLDKVLNLYITKYNTIENGWNTLDHASE